MQYVVKIIYIISACIIIDISSCMIMIELAGGAGESGRIYRSILAIYIAYSIWLYTTLYLLAQISYSQLATAAHNICSIYRRGIFERDPVQCVSATRRWSGSATVVCRVGSEAVRGRVGCFKYLFEANNDATWSNLSYSWIWTLHYSPATKYHDPAYVGQY